MTQSDEAVPAEFSEMFDFMPGQLGAVSAFDQAATR
jgi:hypothetical protein